MGLRLILHRRDDEVQRFIILLQSELIGAGYVKEWRDVKHLVRRVRIA